MEIVKGTKHRQKITDFFERCKNKNCSKVFYFTHDCERKTVACPYCGTLH